MGNAVFPTLRGLRWGVVKTPQFATRIQTAASGRELRAALWSYPSYKFVLSYEVLRDNALAELQTLLGFFLARQGSFDSFLYLDPTDNQATDQAFGVGDGSTKRFQLIRNYGGLLEPVFAVLGTPAVTVNGTAQSGFSVADGVVTLNNAPTAGAVLRWTGQFYFVVRFAQDAADFERFANTFWQARKIELLSVKL